ncbi:MAG: hypothetical protein IPN09_17030 [Bacteroidetes bacterium]|nr:hypothetical protein [Bacteroidota bacterium]
MIYLIDDKKDRQSKYSWTKEKFNFYKDEIVPIWTYEDMESEEFRREMFNEQNILIIHESFFKNIEHDRVNNIVQVKERLKSRENLVIYFSGGIYSRSKNANRIYLPISTLYQNLELFIIKKRQNDINIDYLIYGKNKEIEIELGNKWQLSRNTIINFNDIFNNSNSLLIQSNRYFVYEEKPIGYNSEVLNLENDFTLNDRFDNVFNRNKYDNIFVPLCFGSTLSDFNGLGLACYIRCSKSLNQTTRIFIYGVVSSDYLLQNNYFNILKTKNTHLIDYSIEAFKNAVQKDQQPFLQKELQNELAKLKLDVTEDHVDDHSIANEFGIYQLAYNAGIDINEITDFDKDKLDSLYFKWLIAKNVLYEALPEEVQQENRIFRNKIIIQGFTIVDKIDLTKNPKR